MMCFFSCIIVPLVLFIYFFFLVNNMKLTKLKLTMAFFNSLCFVSLCF